MCTRKNTKKPLNRENTCPRWDSNCIPSPANTGNSRKHNESGPVRDQYDPIHSPKCAQCTHAKLANSEHRSHQPHPRRVRLFCILGQEPSGTKFRSAAASGALCRGGQKVHVVSRPSGLNEDVLDVQIREVDGESYEGGVRLPG